MRRSTPPGAAPRADELESEDHEERDEREHQLEEKGNPSTLSFSSALKFPAVPNRRGQTASGARS